MKNIFHSSYAYSTTCACRSYGNPLELSGVDALSATSMNRAKMIQIKEILDHDTRTQRTRQDR